jgi:TctA family transporter
VLPAFFSSLGEVLEPTTLGLMLVGVAIGFLVGVLPVSAARSRSP